MPYNKKFETTLYCKEWLSRMYVGVDNTASDIARMLGCDRGAVLRRLRKYEIPVKSDLEVKRINQFKGRTGSHAYRPKSKFLSTIQNREWLEEKYVKEGLSCSEISKIAGCSIPSVFGAVSKFNLPIRDAGLSKARKTQL